MFLQKYLAFSTYKTWNLAPDLAFICKDGLSTYYLVKYIGTFRLAQLCKNNIDLDMGGI